MTWDEFLASVQERFGLQPVTWSLDASSLALAVAGGRRLEWSDADGIPRLIVTDEPREPSKIDSINLERTEIDADFHFAAAIIADHNGDEFVHVTEPGPYFDHVFQNLHDEGLSTVEDLCDADEFDPGDPGHRWRRPRGRLRLHRGQQNHADPLDALLPVPCRPITGGVPRRVDPARGLTGQVRRRGQVAREPQAAEAEPCSVLGAALGWRIR